MIEKILPVQYANVAIQIVQGKDANDDKNNFYNNFYLYLFHKKPILAGLKIYIT